MSYPPGRSHMVPNMVYLPSNIMPVMPIPPPPHVMAAGIPMRPFHPAEPPPRVPFSNPPPVIAPPKPESGPPVTVFLGNITERAPDAMIRQVLAHCGVVMSWKRVYAFGFCEFSGPEAGLRAVRLLHDLEIGGKKLVAKVDAKTKLVLDEYKAEERKKLKTETNASSTQDEAECDSEYMGDGAKDGDKMSMEKIKNTISKFAYDINNFETIKEEKQIEKRNKNLQEADIEEEKRDLITREIGKFREIMKNQEKFKENENSWKNKDEREREKEKRESASPRSKSSKEDRKRRQSKTKDRKEKKPVPKTSANLAKEKEVEEENRENKETEKKDKKKEAAYQERKRNWEARERRKAKEYDKKREKERCNEKEREREAKKLKEFLENYDDEKDDIKYYKGHKLQRRIAERVREVDLDTKDRQKEAQELEELRHIVFSGSHADFNQEFERLNKEQGELYWPKIDVNLEQSQQRERELEREQERERERLQTERCVVAQGNRELPAVDAEPIDSDSSKGDTFSSPVHEDVHSDYNNSRDAEISIPPPDEDSLSQHSVPNISSPSSMKIATFTSHNKKKKLDIKDVFNNGKDDEDSSSAGKKRKLIPLDYDDKQKNIVQDPEHNLADQNSAKAKTEAARLLEEKRKHVKLSIEKIPTEKHALFNFPLDWSAIDNVTMERRIRPWINKKIIEYIGEPEPTLVDFICSKVMAGSSPQEIIDDVQVVLDEEAEVFVVKMWRLLIYELEAKKVGLIK